MTEFAGYGPTLRVSILAIVLALVLVGCGRKGALQPPPDAIVTEEEVVGDEKRPVGPDRPFILDGLI